jgi:predicted nucleotidyltransferase
LVIHRALDEVLRSWSHVAVLRTLLDTTTGFSGNEVARLAGMHPLSALKALSSLEVLGIVRRQRGGRDHIFTLNRAHFVVREGLIGLYEAEQRLPGAIISSLAGILRRKVLSAVIFGSVARHEESPASDLDLCCVVKSETDKEKVRESLASQSTSLHETFGVKLAPLIFTLAELRKRAKAPLVEDMVAHGKLVTGKPLKTLLDDTTPKQKSR